MNRYFLRLSYKGTNYCGWQIQKEDPTIQKHLELALTTLGNSKIDVTGCGRTDTGVHALDYFAHFDWSTEIQDSNKFIHQLNGILPDDICVHEVISVEKEAHARFDAISRTYRYFINEHKDPFLKEYSWRLSFRLDHDKIKEASKILIGEQDFECFSKVNTEVNHFRCNISNIEWTNNNGFYMLEITANRFLRGMVRAITGTLIDIGKGKRSIIDLRQIIESKNRSEAGSAAPAHALFLVNIEYPFINNTSIKNFPFNPKIV